MFIHLFDILLVEFGNICLSGIVSFFLVPQIHHYPGDSACIPTGPGHSIHRLLNHTLLLKLGNPFCVPVRCGDHELSIHHTHVIGRGLTRGRTESEGR